MSQHNADPSGTFLRKRVGQALEPSRNLLSDPRLRIATVVLGGLLVLHREDSLNPLKLFYLALAAATVLVAIWHYWKSRDTPLAQSVFPAIQASIVLTIGLGISFFAAVIQGGSMVQWLRDISSYLLVAAAPILAFELRTGADRRWIELFFAFVGTLAALGFFVYWVTLREFIEIGSGEFLLPSFYLAAAAVSYAGAVAISDDVFKRYWLVGAIVVFLLMLLTGTRTTFLLLLVPLTLLFLAPNPKRFVVPGIAAVAVSALAWVVVAPQTGLSSKAGQRLEIVADPGSDQSLAERGRESTVAFNTWKGSPVIGVGAGHEFAWRGYGGRPRSSYLLDSPVGFLAKFGVAGVVLLVLAVARLGAFVHTRRQDSGTRTGANGLLVFGVVAFFGLLPGIPLEDKGFGMGLLFLLALSLPAAESTLLGEEPVPVGVHMT